MIRSLLGITCLLLVLGPLQGRAGPAGVYAQRTTVHAAYAPDLTDVACPTVQVCYTVGAYGAQGNGTIFSTTNGGHTWHRQLASTKWALNGISCPSATRCYSVGYAETTLTTWDSGRTWHQFHTPRSAQPLFRVACPSALTCVATGNSPNGYTSLVHRILLSRDGARTWSYPATPIDHTAFPMNGVACPTIRTCYVVGAYGTILVTADGGSSWREQHNPVMDGGGGLTPPLTGVACASPANCVAVGGFPDRAVVLTTSDGGHHWTRSAIAERAALSDVACPSVRTCYLTGSDGLIAATHDGGQSWAVLPTATSLSLNSIACPSVTRCVVVGNAGFIALLPSAAQHNKPAVPTPLAATPTATAAQVPLPTPSETPSAAPTHAAGCSAWNVTGTWQFQSLAMGNGQITLQQSGSSLSGTASIGGVNWTLQGSIQGAAVSLNFTAPGQVMQSFQGTVGGDGSSIGGNLGTLSGTHASCMHT